MGWLSYDNTSKKQLVNQIKAEYDSSTEWSLVGNNLWALYTVSQKDVDYNPSNVLGQQVILLFKIEYFRQDNGYGYKAMSESVHPYQYNCPMKFLKQAKVECQEWRDEVVKFHENNRKVRKLAANLMIGDIIQLKNSRIKEVKVVSVNPLLGVANSVVYKIPKTMIA